MPNSASSSSESILTSPAGEHAANTVVVGGGLAGLSAVIEAYRAGSHVVLLDKEKNVGGNSAKATSGMNSVHTPAQIAQKIPDSIDKFAADTFKSGGGRSDKLLVKTLTANAQDAHAWLETFGITLDHISQCGGHSVPRTHRESPRPDGKPAPVGWDIIKTLKAYIDKEMAKKSDPEFGSITILNGAKVHDLIIEDDRVHGVRAKLSGMPFELRSDAVILATGGFSASADLLKEFAPHLRHFPTTNGPWASGDGIKFSRALGLSLVDMDQVQLHPTGFIDPSNPDANTKFLAPEALRGHGGILLSLGSGTRFANELGTRAAVVDAIHHHSLYPNQSTEAGLWSRGAAFLVLNQAAVDLFDPAVIGFYMSRGFFKQVDNAVQLAQLMRDGFAGLSAPDATAESVTQVFAEYNAAAEGKAQDKFGKTVFPVMYAPDEKLYVCGITPAIHYTMGGIKINQVGEVLRPKTDKLTVGPEGVPLPGLYAAGEVSGGVHGQNRLAGNSLLECVVFGRIAGQRAAALTKHATLPGLVSDAFTSLTLRSVTSLGHFVKLFRFDLPSSHHTTGLKIGEYVAVRAEINNEQLVRYYSPISRPDDPGHIDLLIKVDDQGAMSKHIDALVPGVDALEFKGPLGKDFPKLAIAKGVPCAGVKRIALVAGGTGISAMIQVIRSVLFHKRTDLEIKLLYGAVAESELVFKDVLIEKARDNPNIKLYFTVDKPDAAWPKPGDNPMFGTGYMSADVLRRELPPPGDDLRVIVCGPWKMCQALKETLTEIGYPKGMWYCFM